MICVNIKYPKRYIVYDINKKTIYFNFLNISFKYLNIV